MRDLSAADHHLHVHVAMTVTLEGLPPQTYTFPKDRNLLELRLQVNSIACQALPLIRTGLVLDLVFAGILRGRTIEQLVKDGKVFFQDYHTVLATDIAPKVNNIVSSPV